MKSVRWRIGQSAWIHPRLSHTRVRSMGIDRVPRIVIVGKWQGPLMQLDICRLGRLETMESGSGYLYFSVIMAEFPAFPP